MNQNNNYNFDPMTGQPINEKPNKKDNKTIILIGIILIIGAILLFVYFNNQNKNNNNQGNNGNSNNNISGSVDKDTDLTNDKTGSFLLPIEDVFTISGRGTVVTGRVQRGTIKVGDKVQIVGLDKEIITTTVTGIEKFRENIDYAEVGDNVGIVLKDVARNQVQRGQVLSKPNSIVSKTKFEADVHMLTKEEGGRHTPFFRDYRPKFYFRTIEIDGVISLPEGTEMVHPGDDAKLIVELDTSVAMEVGTEFTIKEKDIAVGKGKITKVY